MNEAKRWLGRGVWIRRGVGCGVGLAALFWIPWAVARVVDVDRLGWWAVAPQPFILYALAITTLGAIGSVALRRWRTSATALAGCVVLVALVAGREVSKTQPTPSGYAEVTVMVANVRKGEAEAPPIVALVRKYGVDALSLVEVSPQIVSRLRLAGLDSVLPFNQTVAGSTGGGLAAYSRWQSGWDSDLLPPDRPWIPSKILAPGGPEFHFEAMHASPPRGKVAGTFEGSDTLAQMPPPSLKGSPTIVAGDMNASLDNRRLRALLARGYHDAADQVGDGLTPTWHGFGVLALTIDHILVPANAAVEWVHVEPLPGSDHRAVIARIKLPRAVS